jgi:hypothetical protein
VNILDEDISVIECERLRARKIHFRQIGVDVGRLGMKDHNDIIRCCIRSATRLFSPEIMASAIRACSILSIVWCISMLLSTRSLILSAASYGTPPFARGHNVWGKLFASTIAG